MGAASSIDLATSASLTITEAIGINDLGQIVAGAVDAAGTEHSVILTPVTAILP